MAVSVTRWSAEVGKTPTFEPARRTSGTEGLVPTWRIAAVVGPIGAAT